MQCTVRIYPLHKIAYLNFKSSIYLAYTLYNSSYIRSYIRISIIKYPRNVFIRHQGSNWILENTCIIEKWAEL